MSQNGAMPSDSPTAGGSYSPASSPLELVPAMQRSFHALMHAVFEPSTGTIDLNEHISSLIVAAKQLEQYLSGWTLGDRADEMSEEQRLQAEVQQLEAELRQKEQLMALYGGKMGEWAERYRQLEDSNEEAQGGV